MDDEKLEELMDRWAAQEMRAAPEVRPAPEVYRRLEDKAGKHGRRTWPRLVPWAAVGLAGTALVLFIVLRPPRGIVPTVGLREGFAGEKGAGAFALKEAQPAAEAPPRPSVPAISARSRAGKDETGREEKTALPQKKAFSGRVVFEFQSAGAPDVEGWDFAGSPDEMISLSSDDNYRLVIDLPVERHVLVLQYGPGESLTRLFPLSGGTGAGNPVPPGRVLIPAAPNWFFPEKGEGEATIYVVFSARPDPDRDGLLERYAVTSRERERKKILTELFAGLEGLRKEPGGDVSARTFRLLVRSRGRSLEAGRFRRSRE
jgi:hypothetical protein